MQPLLSIVIANYNYGSFLEEAIRSVLCQVDEAMRLPSGDCIELIIVDGGSTDNSVEIIKKYADRLAWWCSEQDCGQSHAFNKGFSQASGRFLTWLNADDILMLGTLQAFEKIIARHPAVQWITGNFLRFTNDGHIVEWKRGPHFLPRWLQRPSAPIVAFGPTSFFSRTLYQSLGGMDERLHYIMDTDLWMRFMRARVFQVRLNHCCWGFRMHEKSKTAEFDKHVLPDLVKRDMDVEWDIVRQKNSYECSRALTLAHKVWRVMDGSLAYSFWLHRFRRHFVDIQSLR